MMKKIIPTLVFTLLLASMVSAQTARLQIIHNSPDHAFDALDIYFGNQKMVDSLPFRNATPYMDVSASTQLVVALQSPDLPDTVASLLRDTISFVDDSTYVLIISGLLSTQPYDSLKPFEMIVHRTREEARQTSNVDFKFFNGSTDAPGLNIDELTGPTPNFAPLVEYGTFTSYKEVAEQDYEFEVISDITKETIAIYFANFSSLGLADSSGLILASGMIDTSQSIPGDTNTSVRAPLFGLYMALPGGGPLIELPTKSGIGIGEFTAVAMEVYPNPATNMIDVVFPEAVNGEVEVKFLDMNGKPVLEKTLYNHSNEVHNIRVSPLKSGYYLLEAKSGNKWFFSTRILIE